MNSQIHVRLSNQTEALYQQLKEQLFTPFTDPFTKRIVVIPSKAMKNWLSLRLAEDLGIATGIEFFFFEPAMRRLEKCLVPSREMLFQLPSQMELALEIENEIRKILEESQEDLWKPMRLHLLDNNKRKLTKKGEKRLVVLSDQLAGLFHQYEKYGKEMLKRWIQQNSSDWQEALWQRVVGQVSPGRIDWQRGNVTVHLFALSYLSRQQHRKLCDLAERIPVHYYLLSPCEVYWSDLLSDRENTQLIRCWEEQGMSNEALSEATELLFEHNPLLANWGRLGRLMAAQIEESPLQTEEDYREIVQESCCLHVLQMDLLKLRHGKHLPKQEFQEDHSIQIHVSTSKTREVQALYQTLLGIMQRHVGNEENISPHDIIVMAPNIKAYEPMIRAVFQSPHSQLDCQIMDLNLLDHNDVIKGFFHLINLSETRWENDTVFNLFSFQSFQEKSGCTQTQVEKIGKWIKEAGIRWGIDVKHRSEILLKNHCKKGMIDQSPAGTWKMGIDRLLLGTAMILPSDDEKKAHYSRRPLKETSTKDQELLGIWSALMCSLREDLKPLEEGVKKSLKEWSEYLLFLLYRYFSWKKRSEEEKSQVAELVACIDNFKISGSSNEDVYPFSTIVYHLKRGLEQKEVHFRENYFQAVRFCSMLPMRAVPAKVVVMMGISEQNYPRKEERSVLNQLYRQKGVDPFPSATEFDRYLFLEAVLSARQYLILSYDKKDGGGEQLHQCSLLISELVQYLDQSCIVSKRKFSDCCVYTHPFFSFDKRYFQEGENIHSYSMIDYQAALSYYNSQEKLPYRFIPEFTVGSKREDILRVIDIKEIKRLARNPVGFYFQKKLGIYLKEEEEVPTDETLTLSSLDLSKFRKGAWGMPIETLLNGAELEGIIPVGPFKDLSIGKISKEVAEVAHQMHTFSIQPEDLFEVVLCASCKRPYREEKKWVFPPLTVESCSITGSLGECSPEGILAYKNGVNRDLAELWPLYLIWCRVIEENGAPFKKEALFVRSGARKVSFFETSLPFLKEYIVYYLTAMEDISPLIPDWVEAFAAGSVDELKSAVQKSVEGEFFFNDEVKWLCSDGNVLQADVLYDCWSKRAKDLYSPLLEHWSGGKK